MKKIVIGAILFVGIAGVLYLATLGCCELMTSRHQQTKPVAFSEQLQLNSRQKQTLSSLEKGFLAKKQASCEVLCAKRAQVIQLLKQPAPDQAVLHTLVEEIGQEQTALEMATVEHLLALRQHLDVPQREKLTALVTEQLRTACQATACGSTPGCAVQPKSEQ